jgi:16S rRNA (adenine1518-N6/adenine1519-N6)-dimethyltransferase
MSLKKSLGQHFLKDEAVLQRIYTAIGSLADYSTVVEIGPGAGALTKYLAKDKPANLWLVELDDRWAAHQRETNSYLRDRIIHEDILHIDWSRFMTSPTHVVGNFPYNISSQIVFGVIDYRHIVHRMTGMFQREVALRIAAKPGNKDYGVLSVLTQIYYDAEYLFDVPASAFVPPPKVVSGVVRITRKTTVPDCDEKYFKRIVKQAFTQRRKTLRNSLKSIMTDHSIASDKLFDLRPEQLSVADFEALTRLFTATQ